MSKRKSIYLAAGIFSLLLFVAGLWSGLAKAAAPTSRQNIGNAVEATDTPTATATTTATPCVLTWTSEEGVTFPQGTKETRDVAALSSDDVWVVGRVYTDTSVPPKLLMEHWNGVNWSRSGLDIIDGIQGELNAVAAVASDDVWAAGGLVYSGDVNRGAGIPLLLHWDGSTWNPVEAPMPDGAVSGAFMDIEAIAADDVWAVGFVNTNNGTVAHMVHWDGNSWSLISSFDDTSMVIRSVSVRAQDDVWALGFTYPGFGHRTMHWNGTDWSIIPVLTPEHGQYPILYAIEAVGVDDVWVVGSYSVVGQAKSVPWILHWDGLTWTQVESDPDTNQEGVLFSIVALAPDDIWAGGDPTGAGDTDLLTMHWDGNTWSKVPGPSLNDGMDNISQMSATADRQIWGIGDDYGSRTGPAKPIMHINTDSCTAPTETPEGTATATPSATSTPAVDACAIDVQRVPGADASLIEDWLLDVDAVAPDDVWAAGYTRGSYPNQVPSRALLQHWDGAQWANAYEAPQPSAGENTILQGVVAVAEDDVWAVGKDSGLQEALLLHWDGNIWGRATYSGSTQDDLFAVDAVAPDDIWAVGQSGGVEATAIHWDGVNWNEVAVPQKPGAVASSLYGVTARSSGDVWAVGSATYTNADSSTRTETFVTRWDGNAWNLVSSPSPDAARNVVRSVATLASNDAWAVGFTGKDSNMGWGKKPLVLHWDGNTWNTVPVPTLPYATTTELRDVIAVTSSDVWAVGVSTGGKSVYDLQTYILHWDGTTWSIVPGMSGLWKFYIANGVTAPADSPGEVWVVGEAAENTTTSSIDTLTMRITRSCIAPVSSATPSATHTATTTGTATATATYPPTSTATTTATETATSTHTATPINTATGTPTDIPASTATATVTATASSTATPTPNVSTGTATSVATDNTPTPTPTVTATTTTCSLQFTDMPEGSTFYAYARCLACRGIISGYECGGPGEPCDQQNNPYFRPGNLITRGQVAKIVANALGLDEAAGAQVFEDVPPGSPFYSYVNRLVAERVMSGYACGGADEPCGASSLPYFRPGANATRGQIAKIVSNAASFGEAHTTQTFADVAANDTFHIWIERLTSRGIMSGYTCGGPGEACGQNNLPYFRPGANATRGQVAKLVANTFLPGCMPKTN